MVRVPRGMHRLAGTPPRGPGWLAPRPGAWRPRVIGQQLWQYRLTGIELTGGQAPGVIGAGGGATVSIGPAGLGTVWYPQVANISTSVGANDGATCTIYLGAQGVPNLFQGQSYAGGGDSLGLPVSMMRPGQLLIAVWSGSIPGATCAINIVGTMDVLQW